MQTTGERRMPWWGYFLVGVQLFSMMMFMPLVLTNPKTEHAIFLGFLLMAGYQGTATIAKSERTLSVRVLICLGITAAIIAAVLFFFRLVLTGG